MNRRSIFSLLAALVLAFVAVVPAGASGKDDFNQYKSFRDVATTRLNALAAGINTKDIEVVDNFTPTGAIDFLGADPLEALSTMSSVEIRSIDHLIYTDDLTSLNVTASLVGINGRSAYQTLEFTLLRQGTNGDYLIDSIAPSAAGAVFPRNANVVDLALIVTKTSATASTEPRDAEFVHLKVFNETEGDALVALYPSGVSIVDPTQMAGRLQVSAGQMSEMVLANLVPGRYIVASQGNALGTIVVK